jgi:hypothetical protein
MSADGAWCGALCPAAIEEAAVRQMLHVKAMSTILLVSLQVGENMASSTPRMSAACMWEKGGGGPASSHDLPLDGTRFGIPQQLRLSAGAYFFRTSLNMGQ